MNELNLKKFNLFEFTTTHFMKKHKKFRNLKRIQKEFEKIQTKKSILFKYEQDETSRQQVDQFEKTKRLSLNINEIEVEINKTKIFTRLNLRKVYHSIRLIVEEANMITFYEKNENNINQEKNILIESVRLMTNTLKQRLLNY